MFNLVNSFVGLQIRKTELPMGIRTANKAQFVTKEACIALTYQVQLTGNQNHLVKNV